MDGEDSPSPSGTPRKSLLRSATWTARSHHNPNPNLNLNPNPNPNPNRPPKPGRLALPPLPPLAAWPHPASDDCGHWPATPSASKASSSSSSSSSSSTPSAAAAHDSDGDISRVDDHVYLGGDAAARDRAALRRHGITHVLNCAGGACPDHFRGELDYRTLWLRDSPAEDLAPVLYDAFDFLERARAAPRGRALVHCRRGASRSAALVVAYLMWRRSVPFDDALRAVRAARPSADPNLGFAAQLLRCQRRVLALPPTPGSVALRAYRIAPQSPYDPLYLVPKSVDLSTSSDVGFLDSRGAFVIHTAATIYVWLGQSCEPAMAAAASTSALQVVHYERAEGPIITAHEGCETAAFWVALNEESPSPNCEEFVGKRRVEHYDLDYDIFRRASAKARGSLPQPMPWLRAESSSPVKESGWSRLRRKFTSRGWKDVIKAVVERRSFDNEEMSVSGRDRSPGSFSLGSSTTPSPSSSADTASVLSTFSPNSTSSSDWYNLSPPRSELQNTQQIELNSDLHSSAAGNILGKDSRSLAERRGGNAPLVLLPSAGEAEGRLSSTDIVRDWCPSPPFISEVEEDQETLDMERRFSLRASDQNAAAEDGTSCVDQGNQFLYPVIFKWPDMIKVEDVHPGVLDSESVYMLLALESKLGSKNQKTKKIYIWLGRDSRNDFCEGKEEDVNVYLDRVGTEFLELMGTTIDTPVQIIGEGQEPEQFLNHLFSFH